MSNDQHRFLAKLEAVIRDRASAEAQSSYTARLLSEGPMRVAQKVGEEGVELALAAAAGSQLQVREEAADLMYHLLVLLHSRELSLEDICAELESRHA